MCFCIILKIKFIIINTTLLFQHLTHEQPLNLVKKDRKRKPSSIEGNTDVVICKLCNSYVVQSLIETHNRWVYYLWWWFHLLKYFVFRDVHGNMDRLVCPDCGKLFTSKRSLFGHKKEKHSGPIEVFPCQDCGKNFSRKANLKVNYIIVSDIAIPEKSDIKQGFIIKCSIFQAHRDSLHFGKKFPCSFCERIFTNRSSMNQHIKKTHSDPIMSL